MAARISATLLRTQPDRRLVALAADGSEPAFEALVDRYRRPLHAYCRRLLLPSDVAEDVVQQALLSTWQALRRGTDIQDPRAWLYRVTHNAALNALRRSGYRYEELDDALQGAGAPDEDLERRTAVRQALAGLAGLPELQRQALLRTAVEGHSHERVARDLGLTDGAVRGLVYRARATLRTAAGLLLPGPAVAWAASAGARAGAPMAERIGELVAGGGAAGGIAALVTKGGATVATVTALAGGAAVVSDQAEREPAAKGRPAAERPVAVPAARDDAPAVVRAAAVGDPEARTRAGKAAAAADLRRASSRERRRGRGRGARDGARRSGSVFDDDTSGRRGTNNDISDDDVIERAADDRSGRSGSGSDSSGSGSDGDSSGPGSGSSDDPSSLPAVPQPVTSTTTPEEDSSGSGSSGSSGSSDSSGSGSDGSRSDSSGSGSGKLPEPDDPEETG